MEGKSEAEPSDRPGASVKARLAAFGAFLVRAYATADPRSLGAFRIVLGLLLFWDVARRIPNYEAFYTNAGWLPNHFALFRPMSDHLFSLYHAFSTPGEVAVLLTVHLIVNAALAIGWYTRVMSVLAALLITSLNSRSIIVENGGYVVLNLVSVWSMFLPLGRAFSVDALLERHRTGRPPNRSPVVSLAVTALILQWVVIYYFNTVHKDGPAWWKEGTAIYYFLEQDRIVTPFGAWVRTWIPLGAIRFLSRSTLIIEGSIPVLLILPFYTRITRKLAWLLAAGLHVSIASLATLGPFSWVMLVPFFAFLDARDWDALEERLKRSPVFQSTTARVEAVNKLLLGPIPEPCVTSTPGLAEMALQRLGQLVELFCLTALILATGSQVLMENRKIPETLKLRERPPWMTALVVYPRLFQGWAMFSPEPPREDGRIVVDGMTIDGRRLDPLTGAEPSYDVTPQRGFRLEALWEAFHTRFHEPRYRPYYPGFRDFLLRHHELVGRPEDRLVSFEVIYVYEFITPPGVPRPPPERRRLFSSNDWP